MIARARLRDAANGDRTPPRRELAAVIAQRDQAVKELADTRDAIGGAKQIVAEAERALAQAASALDETKHEVGKRAAQALTVGHTPPQDQSLREVCIRQLDAESQLAAAQSALAQLEASIEEHQYTIAQANKHAHEAALAVIAAEIDKPRLNEELHAAHARWCSLHTQLYWLLKNDLTGDFDPESAYPRHLDRMRRGGPSVEALRATWNLDSARQSKQSALWDRCVQALSSDAETPLPAA
jgi:chromosome segregation ATPase